MSQKQTIKSVGYARRSTDMQERSIPDQKAFVERWSNENGYRIERWYIDDAISGTSTKGRVAFERMIADAEGGGGFAVVLCYDISRFLRAARDIRTGTQGCVQSRRGEGGRAKSVNRALLSGLIICNHCGHHFLQRHSNSTVGGKRVRYRYYADGGYNRGGKSVCICSNIPADALDTFVVGKIRDILLGDHDGAHEAVDAFVKAAMVSHQNPQAWMTRQPHNAMWMRSAVGSSRWSPCSPTRPSPI